MKTNDYNHAIDEHGNTTDPYGHRAYGVGTEDDFVCFDYMVFEDEGTTKVALHATVNSETGSFIEDFDYQVVKKNEAMLIASEMAGDAIGWAADNEIEPDVKGWDHGIKRFIQDLETELGETTPYEYLKEF